MKKIIKENFLETVRYAAAGFFTTAVNVAFYAAASRILHFSVLLSTVFAWIFSVAVNFILNSKFVFVSEKKSNKKSVFFKKFAAFFAARAGTGIADALLMFVLAEILLIDDLAVKIFVNLIVIAMNYFFAKFIVFKSEES